MTDSNTLPVLSEQRLDQMIHLATSHAQEKRSLPWYRRLHFASLRLIFGMGGAAVTFACIAVFLAMPLLAPPPEINTSEISVSEYILQDLLEDLG